MARQECQGSLDTSGLCGFCRKIDFNGLLGLSPHHVQWKGFDARNKLDEIVDPLHNYRVLDLDRLRHAPHLVSYCDFCRFLEALRPLNNKTDALHRQGITVKDKKAKAYSLYAFCPREVYRLPQSVSHPRLLAVLPTKAKRVPDAEFGPAERVTYILPVTKGADNFSGRLIRERFDISIARRWLRSCNNNHQDYCVRSSIPFIPGFRVIDCQERRIISYDFNSPQPFVALSYKWGSAPGVEAQTLSLPEFLPATIADAIYVTMRLGYNYLWVDRYCISQKDQNVKHIQIQRMNLVYKHAVLTIVAATGEDATTGLYGVRPRKKNVQHSIKLGNVHLVATMDPVKDISESPFNSRGWTFQEGLLSNRRLIFGSRQVYFQCQAMHCLESIKFPLNSVPVYTRWGPRFGKVFPTEEIYDGLDSFYQRLNDYLTRSLSYESDTLNAFNGILKEFETGPENTRLFSFIGLPISSKQGEMTKWLLRVMHIPASLKGLQRRTSFPSWPWAGWKSQTEAKLLTQYDTQLQLGNIYGMCSFPVVNVTVDFGRYGAFDWDRSWWEIIQVANYESRQLRLIVEGWFLDFEILHKDGSLICDDYSNEPFAQELVLGILSDRATISNILSRIQITSPPAWENQGKYSFSWMPMLADLTATFAETFILIKCDNGSHECVIRRLEACPVVAPIKAAFDLPYPFKYDRLWLG
ncbi:unnamed protein product [Clonostachys rhizophaga]|uniref:Heterokaryon incompatibility domain-containing protein n=1 Tax=Clonostachys rhizophaga TaxID=160324 RepID=A0A9N9VSN4_9HYPO|nr:unnamed protein product [Clonostachys rhizophaga]